MFIDSLFWHWINNIISVFAFQQKIRMFLFLSRYLFPKRLWWSFHKSSVRINSLIFYGRVWYMFVYEHFWICGWLSPSFQFWQIFSSVPPSIIDNNHFSIFFVNESLSSFSIHKKRRTLPFFKKKFSNCDW
jgi:hypothetical protein